MNTAATPGQGALRCLHLGSPYAVQRCPMAVQALHTARRAAVPHCRQSTLARLAQPNVASVTTRARTDDVQHDPASAVLEAPSLPGDGPTAAAVAAPSQPEQVSVPAEAPGQDAPMPANQERKKLLMAAIKPPMYSVGFIPVLVAAANVFMMHGVVPWGRMAGFVLAAILVIGWLNLSNDAFDAQTGVDFSKPESVVNLLGGGFAWASVLLLAKSLLVGGVALLAHLITRAPGNDPRPAALLAFSIACGYVYQSPPFRLSYKGLGEPLCFFAFGPSATTAFYLAMQPDGAAAAAATAAAAAGGGFACFAALTAGVPPFLWVCSLLVGLTTTVILFCSHFHQIEGDIAAGKRSPLVRLGTERGRWVLRVGAVATHAVALGAAALGLLPWPMAAATLIAAPAARKMVAFADENHTVPHRVAPLKRFAVKWHILFGLCLCLGLAASRAVGV